MGGGNEVNEKQASTNIENYYYVSIELVLSQIIGL